MSGTFSLPLLNKEPDLICGYIPGIYITRFSISTVPSYNGKKIAWILHFNTFFYNKKHFSPPQSRSRNHYFPLGTVSENDLVAKRFFAFVSITKTA